MCSGLSQETFTGITDSFGTMRFVGFDGAAKTIQPKFITSLHFKLAASTV